MKRVIFVFFLLISLLGCKRSNYKEICPGGVVWSYLQNDTLCSVRVTLVAKGIVKVESAIEGQFDETPSLVALDPDEAVDFELQESDYQLTLVSDQVIVKILKSNGDVSCYNPINGEMMVKEIPGSKRFHPVQVEGVKAYALSQRFFSSDDEALYGLGQHQAHEINYKGKNEELFQYNTKVSVPFVVSTRNYGILWDNYSLTRFGDPRPYGNMDQFKLYDQDGVLGGLTATYVDDVKSGHAFAQRLEQTIDYENLETIKGFPEGFNFSNAKITWEGFIESSEEGVYRFLCYYAGYTKLWVDGELKFDQWRTSWNPSVAKFNVDMKPSVKRHIKLEWFPDGGVSYIGLKALSPMGEEKQNQLSFYSEMGKNMRYYVMIGNSMDDVIGRYRTLTGKAQVMPKWAMGFWQSRERYKTQKELLDVLSEFRKRHIPIDNIVLDWSYWPKEEWGSHDFDLDRFPDAQDMVDQVHQQNARIMISVWPKFYHNTDHYKAFDQKGWMYRRAVKDSIRDWIGKGYVGSFYDAYNPDARQLFWSQIKDKLYSKGFDAWWLDATEPDILSNASIQYRKDLMTPTALGPSTEYFNAYALMNAKGIYEGQRSLNNNQRVFILTRSGFAGIQRYGAVTWSGDIGTRWEDLRAQIPAGINFALSGLPYWTMDIGGFCVEGRYTRAKEGSEDQNEWRELNTRWFQFGAFVPLFRVHGQYPYREVYNIAPETHPAYQSILYYNKLRYRLMPYIYSLAGMTYLNDYTIMRGLAMDFASDKNVHNIGDQYMFGPSLMVCPVHEYKARSRKVYFPKCNGWYNANTGAFIAGGEHLDVDAPYERLPLFVKAGSIIPYGPEIEHTSQKSTEPVTILVYTGGDASFTLYEDEGTNYDYEKGSYSLIPMHWDEKGKVLMVGPRSGGYDGMESERKFRVVFVSPDKPLQLGVKGFEGQVYNYNGEQLKIGMKN